MAEQMKWNHFDAVEMARFLGISVDQCKQLTARELVQATVRKISFNARQARDLAGVPSIQSSAGSPKA